MAWAIGGSVISGIGQGLTDYFNNKSQRDFYLKYQQQNYENSLSLQNQNWLNKSQYYQMQAGIDQKNWLDQAVFSQQTAGLSTPSALMRQHAGVVSGSNGSANKTQGMVVNSSDSPKKTPGGNTIVRSPSFDARQNWSLNNAAHPAQWADGSGNLNKNVQANFNINPTDSSVGTSDPAITDEELGTELLPDIEPHSATNAYANGGSKFINNTIAKGVTPNSDSDIPGVDEVSLNKAQEDRKSSSTYGTFPSNYSLSGRAASTPAKPSGPKTDYEQLP